MATKAKRAYLIFIDDTKNGIDNRTLEDVQKKIASNQAEQLFLIIQSGGGSPFSAVGIMNVLQSQFDKITTVVPTYAKSAATLMSLGTDEIYLKPYSALGPLDLPIEHHRDGSRISALDVKNTAPSMAALVDSIAKDRYSFFRDRGVSKLDASKLALENATQFLEPIMKQVDPYHLQKAERELRIGFWYAVDMLSSRMMKDNFDKAKETARCLVNDFPAHEYSIYMSDAQYMLKLNVKKMADLPEWNKNLAPIFEKVVSKSYHIEYGIIEENVDDKTKPKKDKK